MSGKAVAAMFPRSTAVASTQMQAPPLGRQQHARRRPAEATWMSADAEVAACDGRRCGCARPSAAPRHARTQSLGASVKQSRSGPGIARPLPRQPNSDSESARHGSERRRPKTASLSPRASPIILRSTSVSPRARNRAITQPRAGSMAPARLWDAGPVVAQCEMHKARHPHPDPACDLSASRMTPHCQNWARDLEFFVIVKPARLQRLMEADPRFGHPSLRLAS
jgi:hypothetical protein